MNASLEGEQYGSYVGQIARGAGTSSIGQAVGRLLNYVVQLMLAWLYGPVQLGVYVLGFTIVQIVKTLAQFGLDNGLVRYVAHYRVGGDIPRVRGTILLALGVALGLSLPLSGLLFFSASFLAEVFGSTESDQRLLEVVFEVFSLSIPFFTLMSVVLWATQGFQTVKYANYVEQIAQPLINLGLVVVFYLLGVQILGAVAAFVLSIAAGLVLALYYLKRVFPELFNRNISPKFESRELLGASAPMVVASFAPYINHWPVAIVLGIFATPDVVGIFNVASRTAALSNLVVFAFAAIFAPMISSLYTRGLLEDLHGLYKDVATWTFTGSLAIFLVMTLLARDFMAVFGEQFIAGWLLLVVIAGGELFNGLTGPTGNMLAMTGHHNIFVLANLAVAAVTLSASLVLIPLYGARGAAVSTAGGIVLVNIIGVVAVARTIGFWPYSRRHLKPLVAGLLTAAVAFLVRPVLPLPEGLPAVIILGPCLLTVFGVIILALGLSPSDKQLVGALWSAVRIKIG